jgi:hypothetical protein
MLAAPTAAADAELWNGPALTTMPMSAADTAVIDQTVHDAIAELPDSAGLWIGVWDPDKGHYLQAYGEAIKGSEPAAIDRGIDRSIVSPYGCARVPVLK